MFFFYLGKEKHNSQFMMFIWSNQVNNYIYLHVGQFLQSLFSPLIGLWFHLSSTWPSISLLPLSLWFLLLLLLLLFRFQFLFLFLAVSYSSSHWPSVPPPPTHGFFFSLDILFSIYSLLVSLHVSLFSFILYSPHFSNLFFSYFYLFFFFLFFTTSLFLWLFFYF